MKKTSVFKRINIPYWIILPVIFCTFEYGIRKIYGFTLYPDEFGYWASAAAMAGYDWSEIASLGSYYSFGYSAILFPLLKLFSGGIAAYRAALFVNMALLCAGFCLLHRIAGMLFPETRSEERALICGAAAFYPVWFFYAQTTMAEALLIFLFVLDVYLFLVWMRNRRLWAAALLTVSLVYGYCVHMRMAGVMLSCLAVCFIRIVTQKDRRKSAAAWTVLFLLLLCVAAVLKSRTIASVFHYADRDTLSWNDFGSQWEKIGSLFTVSGMVRFLGGIVGKLYYLGLSSMGIFYWGLIWCVRQSALLFRRKAKDFPRRPTEEEMLCRWTGLLLLLAVIVQVCISSIYLLRTDTVDGLLYGRYNEMLLPVMIVAGMVSMRRSRRLLPVTLGIEAALGAAAVCLNGLIGKLSLTGIRGCHIEGISYLLQENAQDSGLFMRDAWLLGAGMTLFTCLLLWISRQRKSLWWVMTGVLAVHIACGIRISDRDIYQLNAINYENLAVAKLLARENAEGKTILYLDENYPEYVDFLQMQMPETPIHVTAELREAEQGGQDCVVVVSAETAQDQALSQLFARRMSTEVFHVYYDP